MKMLAFSVFCTMFTACASIVSYSKWPVRVTTTPPGALVTITDASGRRIHEGVTPANVDLRSSQGYFKREKYEVTFDLNGYRRTVPLECKINGWYWGNLFIGGAIGLLIIDPATGAMYKFRKDYINERMIVETGEIPHEIHLFALQDLPASVRGELELFETTGGSIEP